MSDNLIPIERLSNEYIDTKKERKKEKGKGKLSNAIYNSGGRMGLAGKRGLRADVGDQQGV